MASLSNNSLVETRAENICTDCGKYPYASDRTRCEGCHYKANTNLNELKINEIDDKIPTNHISFINIHRELIQNRLSEIFEYFIKENPNYPYRLMSDVSFCRTFVKHIKLLDQSTLTPTKIVRLFNGQQDFPPTLLLSSDINELLSHFVNNRSLANKISPEITRFAYDVWNIEHQNDGTDGCMSYCCDLAIKPESVKRLMALWKRALPTEYISYTIHPQHDAQCTNVRYCGR